MASACIRSNILNTHRTNNNNSNNLTLPSIQNNQNFIIISQSNFNQITQQSQQQQITTTMPVQKLKNLTTIAPAPTTSNTPTTNSILGMNSINIQSNQCNNIQQSNNCGVSGSINMNGGGNIGSYKKKYTYANIPYGTELPPSVARRNARERNRVKQVNNGYANLRQHIPQTIITSLTNGGRGASKKLSKVDTLRLAVEYIRRLQDVLVDDGASDNGSDGGSLYNSGSSILSSGTDCEDSPQSSTYYHNVESPINENNHRLHQQQYNNHNGQLRTSNNDYIFNQIGYSDPSASPAPSYTSEISIGSDHKFEYLSTQQSNLEQQQHQQQQLHNNHNQNNVQFKFEPYDNSYNSITDTTQEDEELLDYISSWQDQ